MYRLIRHTLSSLSLLAALSLGLIPNLTAAVGITLTADETAGYARRAEAVSTGIPLPRAAVTDLSTLSVTGPQGAAVQAQFETLSTWPDGSVKWLLVDFFADCPAQATARYRLSDNAARPTQSSKLKLEEDADGVTVETGVMRCRIERRRFDPFGEVWLDHDGDGVWRSKARWATRTASHFWITPPD